MSYNLRHFVDRESQLEAFRSCLLNRERGQMLLFHGSPGMGKTCLLYRLRTACQEAKVACALIDFQHDDLNLPEALIHRLRQQIGNDFFDTIGKEMEALEQAFPEKTSEWEALPVWTGGSPVYAGSPATAMTIQAQVGNIGDHAIVAVGDRIIQINNSQIYLSPEKGTSLIHQERLRRLSQAMSDALERWLCENQLVLLLDACDSTTPDMIRWLREQLLDPLLYHDQIFLDNLIIVLVGDPRCERGAWLNEFIDRDQGARCFTLGNLPPEAVLKYWIEIRCLSETTLPQDFRTRGAPPFLMIDMANFSAEV